MATSAVSAKKDDGYRLKKHGKIGSSVPIGDKTIAPGVSHLTVVRPQQKEGALWFRIAPTLNKANVKELAPMCYMDEPDLDNLTDWVRQMPAARYMGVEGGERCTAFLHHPNDESYDPWKVNPYYLLYRFAKRAFSNTKSQENRHWKPEWNSVVHGKEAGLKSPDVLYTMLGYIYESGKERYYKDNGVPLGLGENDGTILIQLPKSAGESIVTTAGEANPDYHFGVGEYDPKKPKAMLAAFNDYFEKAHKYGDVISLKTGRCCCVHDPERFPIEQLIPGKTPKIGISTSKKGGGKKEEFSRYEAFWRKYYYFRQTQKFPVDLSAFEATVKSRIQFLSEILYVPSHEELALWIAFAFKPVAKLLQLAWSDHSEFMTDDVRKVLALAKTVAVAGKKPRAAAAADITAPSQEDLPDEDAPVEDDAIDHDEDDLPELPPEEGELNDELPPEDDEGAAAEGEDVEGEDVDPEEAEAPEADGSEDDLPPDEEAEVALDELPPEEDEGAAAEGDDDEGLAEDDLPPDEDVEAGGDEDALPDEDAEAPSAEEDESPPEPEEDALPEEDDEAAQRPRPQTRRRAAPAPATIPEEDDPGEGPPVVTPRPRSPKPAAAKPAAAKPAATKPAAAKPAAAKPGAGYYKQPAATAATDAAAAKRTQQKAAADSTAKARASRRTAQ